MSFITAVVSTHNRPQLLAKRALESITRRSRPQDYLVVVDDAKPKATRVNGQIVGDCMADGTKTIYP